MHLCDGMIGQHTPQVNVVVCECAYGLIEICANPNEYVADLGFRCLPSTPSIQRVLELLCRNEEITHGRRHVTLDPLRKSEHG
jgi:nicotinamide riboside kinase